MAKGADVLVHEAMYVPAMETYIRGEIAQGQCSIGANHLKLYHSKFRFHPDPIVSGP